MLKKIVSLLAVVSIMAGLLSACGKTSSDNSVQTRLDELNAQAKKLINQPGWVHVTEKITYDTDLEDRGVMPKGQVVPLIQTVDIWYHLNDRKLVYEYVWLMTNQDGELVQVIVFLNNVIHNLMTTVSTPMNPYSLGPLDHQFSSDVEDYVTRLKKQPVLKVMDLNGESVAVFTVEEQLETPSTIDDYQQPVTAVRSVAYFDQGSGLLRRIERFVTLEDGSERAFYTNDITIEIKVQPPQDILDYTNRIW